MAAIFLIVNTVILVGAAWASPAVSSSYETSVMSSKSENPDISWPANQAIPRFGEPAETLIGINISEQPFDTQVLTGTIQGIINRTKPRILVFGNTKSGGHIEGGYNFWPDNMGLNYTETTDLDGLIKQYADEIDGTIIYDESRMDTINVATTLAGLYNCIVTSPTMAQRYYDQFGLEMKMDLRTAIPADLTQNTEIYDWLYENYRLGNTHGNPSYNDRLVVGLNPGENGNEGGHSAARDYATAMNAPVIWLDPGVEKPSAVFPATERACVEKFVFENKNFDKANSTGNPYYMGWWPSEEKGIRWATSRGWPTIPSDNFENYTVYSGMSDKVNPPETPAKPDLENKIYVSFVVSDGDNIAYNENSMHVEHLWRDENRGHVPISWTISPALIDAAPQMLEYYYKTATPNDNLISGPSGIGYTRASNYWQPLSDTGYVGNRLTPAWPNKTFAKNYGSMTNSYFEKTNLNLITIWRTITQEQTSDFSSKFPSLLGLTVLEQTSLSDKTLNFANNVPIMYLGTGLLNRGLSVNERCGNDMSYCTELTGNCPTLTKLRKAAKSSIDEPRFYVFQYIAWNSEVSPTNFKNIADTLNSEFPGKFEFVRLDHLTMLVNEQNGKPINCALQADVSSSGADSGYDASKAVDGTFAPENGWKSSADGDKWVTVDLGRSFKLSRYVLKNAETAYHNANLNTKDYKVQSSVDGVHWKDIDTVTGNTDKIVYHDVDAETARYVRLYITDPGADGVARVQDFEVYGIPTDDINDEPEQSTDKTENNTAVTESTTEVSATDVTTTDNVTDIQDSDVYTTDNVKDEPEQTNDNAETTINGNIPDTGDVTSRIALGAVALLAVGTGLFIVTEKRKAKK